MRINRKLVIIVMPAVVAGITMRWRAGGRLCPLPRRIKSHRMCLKD